MPTIEVTALSRSPFSSSSDPAPRSEDGKSHDDRVDRQQDFVERRHFDLEPIDQSGGDRCNNPRGDERCEAPIEKRPPRLGPRRLG